MSDIRIVSMYKWEEQVKNEPAMKSGALPFEKYCEYIYKAYHGIESFDLIEGFVCNSIYRHMHHEKEKGHFISHYNKMYRNGEQIFDFIGKYENLAEDMQIVCDQIGIINKPLPMINKTNHDSYREYYSDESRQRIDFFISNKERFLVYKTLWIRISKKRMIKINMMDGTSNSITDIDEKEIKLFSSFNHIITFPKVESKK